MEAVGERPPLTGESIAQLIRHASKLGIEADTDSLIPHLILPLALLTGVQVVPWQSSLRMPQWLSKIRYKPLAECPTSSHPQMLCSLDAGAVQLMAELYDQLVPHFESGLLGITLTLTLTSTL